MKNNYQNIVDIFLNTVKKFGHKSALCCEDREYSYNDYLAKAIEVAKYVEHSSCQSVIILGDKQLEIYAAILGVMMAGKTYVPINPHFPLEKNVSIIASTDATLLLVSENTDYDYENLISNIEAEISCCSLSGKIEIDNHRHYEPLTPPNIDDYAYTLFTSGSTGVPKGISIKHQALVGYIIRQAALFEPNQSDRFSQNFDLTFDLSIHDIFLPIAVGASLHIPSSADKLLPDNYIKRELITFWFSVPSIVGILNTFKRLANNSFPSIRYSLFCGEKFPIDYARLWEESTSNSRIFNLYGPTEATIAFTFSEFVAAEVADIDLNTVPIGYAFEGLETIVVDKNNSPVNSGEVGSLLLGGDQVFDHYINSDETPFIHQQYDGYQTEYWYETGDTVVVHPTLGMIFHGRGDTQFKIRGYRVDINEVELAVRTVDQFCQVAVVPIMDENRLNTALKAFVEGNSIDQKEYKLLLADKLPDYAIPSEFVFIDQLPKNANGKIDYKSLKVL